MARYLLTHRRSGLFTDSQKVSARASVAHVLGMTRNVQVVHDLAPQDQKARRLVILDADAFDMGRIAASLPPDAILEPLVARSLHRLLRPRLMGSAIPTSTSLTVARTSSLRVSLKIVAGGQPLPGIDVMLYLSDASGQLTTQTVQTDAEGSIRFNIPSGQRLAMVEPIPLSGFWIMLAQAPQSGATLVCTPIQMAGPKNNGWWHDVMGVDTTDVSRGGAIRVGVIDTGCGPHPNLVHVVGFGAFVDGAHDTSPGATTDRAQHGTHTTGIVGARPTKPGDYAGYAAGCNLFHARVFKGEGPQDGPTQADLINAIDALSRDNSCDLINMSLGGGDRSDAEEDAILDAAQRGTLCICSAGNSATAIEFPGAYPECAAVSAIGQLGWAPPGTFSAGNTPDDASKLGAQNLFLATFSCFAQNGQTLACTAPGVGIVSTVPDRAGATGQYMEMDGTSMASPSACGLLAVLLAADPTYKTLPRDISRTNAARRILADSSVTIGLAPAFQGTGLPRE
jgi:subtilisin